MAHHHQSDGDSDNAESGRNNEEATSTDSTLCKRAIQVRDGHQDAAYAWIIKTLELIFEYFPDSERDKHISDLTKVMGNYCLQDLEYNVSKTLFDQFTRANSIKNTPNGFSYSEEFEKILVKEGKVGKGEVKKHPKYLKFLERVKELEKGKQLSQTDAVPVD